MFLLKRYALYMYIYRVMYHSVPCIESSSPLRSWQDCLSNGHLITLLPLDYQKEDWSWIVPHTMISSPSSNILFTPLITPFRPPNCLHSKEFVIANRLCVVFLSTYTWSAHLLSNVVLLSSISHFCIITKVNTFISQ